MMQKYLASGKYVDWQVREVSAKAKELASGKGKKEDIAKACFEFVRDEIMHSSDYRLNPVTCKASDVLKYGTGFCYAKSHLLAALLRANDIPAALCYQRLTIENNAPPFCLHGLNAVFLEPYGWYRMDPRGNKPGVDADFCPPVEKLAFSILTDGEANLAGMRDEPLEAVVKILENSKTYLEVANNLPDAQEM